MFASFLSRIFTSGGKGPALREDLYRSAFEQSPVGIALVAKDGQFLQFNERLTRLLGYTAEELVQTSVRELTHPEDRKIESPHMRRLTMGEITSYTIEKRVLHRSRKYVDVRVTATRCRHSPELDYFEFVFAPGSESGTAGESSQAKSIDAALENALGTLEDIGILHMAPDGTITKWSRGAEKIFGFTTSEVMRKPRSVLYRDADAFEGQPQQDLQQALTQGLFDHEGWRVNKEGFAIWTHTTLIARRDATGVVDLIEFVRTPSHAKNPAHEAFRRRSEQLLAEAKAAYNQLQRESEEKVAEIAAAMDEKDRQLRQRIEERTKIKQKFEELTATSSENFRELKIMAEALKKEMTRRREMEKLLEEARREIADTNDRWRAELDRVTTEAVEHAPAAEEPASLTDAEFEVNDVASFTAALLRLAGQDRSGTLVVRNGEMEKHISLDRGRIIACISPTSQSPLGELLIRRGLITEEQRDHALEMQQQTQIAFGRILLLMNAITQEQLLEVMTERSLAEAAPIFDWDVVEYAFVSGEIPQHRYVPLRLSVPSFFERMLDTRILLESSAEPVEASEFAIVRRSDREERAASEEPDLSLDDTVRDLPVPDTSSEGQVADETDERRLEAEEREVAIAESPDVALAATPQRAEARAASLAPENSAIEREIEVEREQLEDVKEPPAELALAPTPVPEELAIESTAADGEASPFIGSGTKKSKKYHLPTCKSVAKLSPKSRIPLNSREEAEADGFVACGVCLKPKKTVAAKKKKSA